jgi:transcriptional regulator with XRE-family HTH domain
MNDLQRVKKVINWLIFDEFAENETEIAQKLGYTKSSFSQIINGKVPLSERFIDKLCESDKNINKVWIMEGKGKMLKTLEKKNQSIIGDNNIQTSNSNIDARQYYSDSPDILKAQIDDKDKLLHEKDERLREKDVRLREKDEYIQELKETIKELKNK